MKQPPGIYLDPARPTWPGVLCLLPDDQIIPVEAGTPLNFADSLKAAQAIMVAAQLPWEVKP